MSFLLLVDEDRVAAVNPEGVVGEVEGARRRWQTRRGISPDDPLRRVHHDEAVVAAVGDQEQPGEGAHLRRISGGGGWIRAVRGQERDRDDVGDGGATRAAEDQGAAGCRDGRGIGHRATKWVLGLDATCRRVVRDHGADRCAARVPAAGDVREPADRERRRMSCRSGERAERRDRSRRRVEDGDGVDEAGCSLTTGDHERRADRGDHWIPQSFRQVADRSKRPAVGRRVDLGPWRNAVIAADEVNGVADGRRGKIGEVQGQPSGHGARSSGRIERLHDVRPGDRAAAEHIESPTYHGSGRVVERVRHRADRRQPPRRGVEREDVRRGDARCVEASREVDDPAVEDRHLALDRRGQPVRGERAKGRSEEGSGTCSER